MKHEAVIDQPMPVGAIGFFEKWLSVWVALCIVTGIVLGNTFPSLFSMLATLEYASVNLVVAVLIWAMVFPMMVNVDFASLRHIGDRPKGLIITIVVNWLIKPFTMAALGILFFEVIFADMIAPADAQQYIAGLILLGAAPCTAMVFVWSQLTRGDATYTLVQVSLNDVIMIFAFAPIVASSARCHRSDGALGDAPSLGRPLRRRAADRGRHHAPAVNSRFGWRRCFCRAFHGCRQADLRDWAPGHGGTAVWLSGANHHRSATA